MIDYYSMLGINSDADLDEIEDALANSIISGCKQQQDIILGYEILINEQTRKMYDRAINAPPGVCDCIYQAVMRMSRREFVKAGNICYAGLREYPLQREICLTLCDINEAMNDSVKNLDILVELYNLYPEDSEVVFYLGLVYMDSHKFYEAYMLLYSIYDPMSSNMEYLAYYSIICIHAKKYDEAKDHALKVIEQSRYAGYTSIAYTALFLSLNYTNKDELAYYIILFCKYINNQFQFQHVIKDVLEQYASMLTRMTVYNSPVKELLTNFINIYNSCDFRSNSDKRIIRLIELCREIFYMREIGICSSLVDLSCRYVSMLEFEIVHEIKMSSTMDITISKIEVIDDYLTAKEQIYIIGDRCPVFAALIQDFTYDLNKYPVEALTFKYKGMLS